MEPMELLDLQLHQLPMSQQAQPALTFLHHHKLVQSELVIMEHLISLDQVLVDPHMQILEQQEL